MLRPEESAPAITPRRAESTCRRWCVAALISIAAILGCGEDPAAGGNVLGLPDGGLVDSPSVLADAGDSGADASEGDPPFSGPLNLSETGLFSDTPSQTLASGVLAYDVRYPLWSDGSEKKRHVLLPSGTQIDTSNMDVWSFPVGTKAWKEFRVAGKLLETRFLWKQGAGVAGWLQVAYVWNAAGTDAVAVPDGVADVSGTNHDVPGTEQCEQCHNGAGDVLIGVSAFQLSKENGGGALATLIAQNWLSQPPAAELPVPGDGVVEDAIGYLHGNCGHCHNDESFLAEKRALRLKLLTSAKTPEDMPVYKTALGGTAAHDFYGTTIIVTPGSPVTSQLYQRMKVRNLDQMPPLGTEVVDDPAVAIVGQWISGLPSQ